MQINAQQGLGDLPQFRPALLALAQFIVTERKTLDRDVVQPGFEMPRAAPQIQRSEEVQSRSEAGLSHNEHNCVAPGMGQPAPFQKNMASFCQSAALASIHIAKALRIGLAVR